MIDINCIIDYYAFVIFISNYDWPTNNMRCRQDGNGPWRWIFYDGDAAIGDPNYDSFKHATDTSAVLWPTNKRATMMFRKLLTNMTFCQNFIEHSHELLETSFHYVNTSTYKQQIADEIAPELQNQIDRFKYPANFELWTDAISDKDDFLRFRPTIINNLLVQGIPVQNYSSEINCFPNPTTDIVNINMNECQWGLYRIDIFNIQGQAVYSDIVLTILSLSTYRIFPKVLTL